MGLFYLKNIWAANLAAERCPPSPSGIAAAWQITRRRCPGSPLTDRRGCCRDADAERAGGVLVDGPPAARRDAAGADRGRGGEIVGKMKKLLTSKQI